jgi:hypothetical protein
MSKIRTALVLAAFLLLLPSLANAQCSSSTPLPPGTVLGRLLAGPGPCQAIPFANLLPNLVGVQSANKVYAGPTTGVANIPAFRSLVGADLPAPGASSLGGVQTLTCSTSNWFKTLATTGIFGCSQPAYTDLTGFGTGVATALGNATNAAGGLVTFSGALGTPTSGTGTNLTGIPTTGLTGTLQAAQEPAHTGDCTNSAGSLALNCLQTNGVSFTPTATAGAGQLPGEPSTGSAAAGKVGEFSSNTCALASITTGTQTNCSAGLSLTAGDWDVQAVIYYTPAASTNMADMYCSVSLTSAVLDQTTFNYVRMTFGAGIVPGAGVINTALCPTRRVSVSTTTPVFAVAFVDFTVSTMQFSGGIRARRVR